MQCSCGGGGCGVGGGGNGPMMKIGHHHCCEVAWGPPDCLCIAPGYSCRYCFLSSGVFLSCRSHVESLKVLVNLVKHGTPCRHRLSDQLLLEPSTLPLRAVVGDLLPLHVYNLLRVLKSGLESYSA